VAITQNTITLQHGLPEIEINVPFKVPPEANSKATFMPHSENLSYAVATTGGTIIATTNRFYYLAPIDSDGNYGPLSNPIEVLIPNATNTNKVTISGPNPFDLGAVNYEVYLSLDDPWSIGRISGPTAVPAIGGTLTITDDGSVSPSSTLPPDLQFTGARAYWRKSGDTQWLFGAQTPDRSVTSLKFTIPYNVNGQVIEIQLRSLFFGGVEMAPEVAPIFTYTVTGVAGQLSSTFINNPVDTGNGPTANPLTQSGTSTTILVASSTYKFGSGNVTYNSGSVNPGSLGTFGVTADDSGFGGGAVTYAAQTALADVTAARGRVYFGAITTVGGGGGTGTGGGGGACVLKGSWLRTANGKIAVEDSLDKLIATPYGEARVIWLEELADQPLYLIEPVNAGDFEPLYASGFHTLRIWGLWHHLKFVHLDAPRGIKLWVEGSDVGRMARIVPTDKRGTVLRLKLDAHHIYSAHGIWSHNIFKVR
jgi:hypothetical protein